MMLAVAYLLEVEQDLSAVFGGWLVPHRTCENRDHPSLHDWITRTRRIHPRLGLCARCSAFLGRSECPIWLD